jgi:hypothetical protein
MTIYYLNDKTTLAFIRVIDLTGSRFVTLQPHTGQTFDLQCPDGAIPFVKDWDGGAILLSYMDSLDGVQT